MNKAKTDKLFTFLYIDYFCVPATDSCSFYITRNYTRNNERKKNRKREREIKLFSLSKISPYISMNHYP